MPPRKSKAQPPARPPLAEQRPTDTNIITPGPAPSSKSTATKSKGKKRDIESLVEAATTAVRKEMENPNPQALINDLIQSEINDLVSDSDEDDEDDPTLDIIKYSPAQIRNRIRSFINSGEMKVYEFCDAIGVSNNAYQRFMKESGQKGQWSDTYAGAHRFFVKRERKGIKISRKQPPAKKAKTGDLGSRENGKEKSKTKQELEEEYDVSSITLEGEDQPGGIAIFDTCDDVRTKLNAHLRRPGITMAGFGREIAKTYNKQTPSQEVTIQHKQIKDFLEKHGARSGCTSKVFYGAYVYFEKLRIKQNKPKSKKREEMERIHGKKGLDIKTDQNHMHFWGMVGEVFYEDSYGCSNITRGGKASRMR